MTDRTGLAARLATAVAGLEHPVAPLLAVDLDAFEANAADLARRAGGVPIRVASKSLRIPALIRRALDTPGFAGVLAFGLAEALRLFAQGISEDLVVAYPTVDAAAVTDLLADPAALAAITLMIDDPAHLDLIDGSRRAGAPGAPVRIALDLDAALRLGPARLGPQRSPLRDADAVVRLAREVLSRPGFALVGVMTYEGQVAGLPDDAPGQRLRSAAVRRIKAASIRQLAEDRERIGAALAELVDLEFWNAGGSGSLESSGADPRVTEVAAGSGLLVPTLFDHYRSFAPRPAAFFGVPVLRRPSDRVATLGGAGLIASGATGADRAPTPWLPAGLRLTGTEGAGEVQTPVTGPGARGLAIGDWVWFRHAKSGEVAEHAREAHLLRGDRFVEHAPTYRGLGSPW